MNRSAAIALGLVLSAPTVAFGQSNCPSIAESTKRLACYDALNSANSVAKGSVTDFDDFVTDIASLRGKEIKLYAYLGQLGNMTVGYRKDVFGPFVILDTSELSRDDRRKLNKDCVASVGLCGATITGKATNQFGQAGIRVTGVAWN